MSITDVNVFLYDSTGEQGLENEVSLQRESSQVKFICTAHYHISLGSSGP